MTLLKRQWRMAKQEVMPETVTSWIMEPDSMTRRFERSCKAVHVELCYEGFIDPSNLMGEYPLLPHSEQYWLREVVLYGDNIPWLFGRTVIPETTLVGEESQLLCLGNVPLGYYLFSGKPLTRDLIQVSCENAVWARRCRLCIAGKPLLLTEVFLPESPVYWV